MGKRYLEAGRIINTHGVRGEVKIEPWTDSPEFFIRLKRVFIDGSPVDIRSAKVHKNSVIAAFSGVGDIDGAIGLKNKTVYLDRGDVPLEEGRHFVADIVGLRAVDDETGDDIGVITEVLARPANDVYVISGEREILVPVVPEFIARMDMEEGYVRIHMLEGM